MVKVKVNGIRLAYERLGSGKPLVLLHGYPLDHTIWKPVVPWLEDRADLVLPDLRGFGGSTTTAAGYSLVDMAADVAAVLDLIKVRQAVIAGHSMGGYVALAFARAYPERVLGLGLVASQAAADTPEGRQSRFETIAAVEAKGIAVVTDAMPARLTADPGLQAELREVVLRQRPEGIIAALKAMADRPDSTSSLSTFGFPVAIIHGRDDKLIPIERAREVEGLVQRGWMVEVENAGHMPMLEAPQVTAQALLKLL